MKKLFCLSALILGACSFAQAQVYFGPGSARAINPGAATRDIDRRAHVQPRAKARVRCRDGSMHGARVCRRHGGG